MLWILGGVIMFVLLLLLITRIYIRCDLTYQRSQQTAVISIFVYRIKLFTKKINLEYSMDPDGLGMFTDLTKIESNLKGKIQKTKDDYAYIISLLSVIRFHRLKWHTKVGTGSANTTGIAVGITWTVKGLIIGSISNLGDLSHPPRISVVPHFQELGLESHIDCICSMKIGHAMYAFLKIRQNTMVKKEAYS